MSMPSKRLPVAHVVMRIKQGIRALCVRDVIDCVSELAEILGHSQRVTGNVAKKQQTVSLNLLPKPEDKGHMRSIRNVTRKKLIFSWFTNMSTVL